MANNDVYKLSLVGTLGGGQEFVMGFHYKQIGASIVGGAEALAKAAVDQCLTEWLSGISTAYILTKVEVRQVAPLTVEGWDEPVDEGGVQSGDPSPPQTCVIISKLTGLVGRKYRGRVYWVAPSETSVSGGALLTGVADAYTAIVGSMLAIDAIDGSSAVFGMVLFHKEDLTSTPIVNFVTQPTLGTQRRRRVGVGS